MNLFTFIWGAHKASPRPQLPRALPLKLIKFHLSEAQRTFGLEEYSQALFHCEEVMFQDSTNAEAHQMHEFIRLHWKDYIGDTQDSLYSFLWRPKRVSTR